MPATPVTKIVAAWKWLKEAPLSLDKTAWEATGGADADRKVEDRLTKATVHTVSEAQTILTAHNDPA